MPAVGILMPLAEQFEVLPTNVEYPYFDVYKSPAYWIIYIHHIYYKPATCIIDGVMDTILAAFIASASKRNTEIRESSIYLDVGIFEGAVPSAGPKGPMCPEYAF